jgi:magnesium chelatase subunit D
MTRATICLVEVGMAEPRSELRARKTQVRSMNDPRMAEALWRPQGRATPLAHGLALAVSALRRNVATSDDLILLAVTDGRGNVPISASRAGALTMPVGSEGMDDSLRVASRIRTIRGIRALVLDPDNRPVPSVSARLADALGGSLHREADV